MNKKVSEVEETTCSGHMGEETLISRKAERASVTGVQRAKTSSLM